MLGYELPPGILSAVQIPCALRGPGGGRLSLSDWASDSSVDRILVRGVVGAGKSSLLRDYHRDQCRRALADAELPIPLLLRVRDLVDRDAIDVAAGGLRMDIEGCKFLLADPGTEWLLLLDGADEHPRGWHVIESVVSQFGGRCRVIVSSRPVGVPHLSRYRIVDLEAWDEHSVEVYLSRWESQDAAPVQLLRASPAFRELRKTLLGNPLLATLCLVVATRRKRAPSSRTDLYLGVTELLFEAWRKQRNAPQVLWHTVAPAVSEIAYRYLETGAAIESSAIVEVMRCQGMVPVTEAAHEVERHLGVFIPTAEGTYDFLFRGLAEHLAAEKAQTLEEARLLDLARHGWAEEVVRHVVGHAAIQSETKAIQLVRMLSCAASTAEPAYDASYLRPFLIAVRICHDLPAVAEVCAQEISIAAQHLLKDETSCWIGERVAAELSQQSTDSPLLAALLKPALAFLDTDESPADWFACDLARSKDGCVDALLHCEPAVRILGIQRLDGAESIGLLLRSLFDDGRVMFPQHDSPALQAGLVIRRAPREPEFEKIRARLERLLGSSEWMVLAAAASALRPSEADPRALARALQFGAVSVSIPVHVIDELVAAHEPIVTEYWPHWRETRERLLTAA